MNKQISLSVTFIPGIWTHSTAVPVAFERNSAKVSSAMDKSLPRIEKREKGKTQIDKLNSHKEIHTTRCTFRK